MSDTFVYAEGELIPKEDARILEVKGTKARRAFAKRKLTEDEKWMLLPEAIQEREFPMFLTLTDYVMDKVSEYILAKAEESKSATYTSNTGSKEYIFKDLAKDIRNSPVLDRLLSGKPMLDTPPPKSYLHSWYELIDDGEDVCIDVTFTTKAGEWKNGQTLPAKKIARIDNEDWTIIREIEEDKSYVVQWKETQYLFVLSRMDADDFKRLLNPRLRKMVTKNQYSWKLTRWESSKDE